MRPGKSRGKPKRGQKWKTGGDDFCHVLKSFLSHSNVCAYLSKNNVFCDIIASHCPPTNSIIHIIPPKEMSLPKYYSSQSLRQRFWGGSILCLKLHEFSRGLILSYHFINDWSGTRITPLEQPSKASNVGPGVAAMSQSSKARGEYDFLPIFHAQIWVQN